MTVPIESVPTNFKFKHNGMLYTVVQHARSMVEVYGNGRYWAWPTNTGKDSLKVELI